MISRNRDDGTPPRSSVVATAMFGGIKLNLDSVLVGPSVYWRIQPRILSMPLLDSIWSKPFAQLIYRCQMVAGTKVEMWCYCGISLPLINR